MTEGERVLVARSLAKARLDGTRLDAYPGPAPADLADLAEAYAVQELYIEAMGLAVVGWKVGCTSRAGQDLLEVREPIAGPLFETLVCDSPAVLAVTRDDSRIVEAEIALRLKRPLPPRDKPYARQEVLDAIGHAMPAFELANKRLPGTPVDRAEWLVADGAIDAAVVLGRDRPFSVNDDLSGETVAVAVDGEPVTDGVGGNALGGPVNVLTWLANHLSERGHGLRAGDVVSTGVVAGVVIGEPGQDVRATFATLGTVDLRLALV